MTEEPHLVALNGYLWTLGVIHSGAEGTIFVLIQFMEIGQYITFYYISLALEWVIFLMHVN